MKTESSLKQVKLNILLSVVRSLRIDLFMLLNFTSRIHLSFEMVNNERFFLKAQKIFSLPEIPIESFFCPFPVI